MPHVDQRRYDELLAAETELKAIKRVKWLKQVAVELQAERDYEARMRQGEIVEASRMRT